MMQSQQGPLLQSFKCLRYSKLTPRAVKYSATRPFSTRVPLYQDVQETVTPQTPPPPPPSKLDPERTYDRKGENELFKSGVMPIGSRRRRAAVATGGDIPFEQLPYQCFQEARKVLQADREEKVKMIEVERQRIARLEAQEPYPGTPAQKQLRLQSMRKHLEYLKIQADINDPMVKKRFEDGKGDMNKPVYRHLADRKWRSYRRLLIMQRMTQMKVIPDVLPHVDPVADVSVSFRGRTAHPGDFVHSTLSEEAPRLNIQCFDRGERLVTIAVVDPDVPVVEQDGFKHRCHFLASNIRISPAAPVVQLESLDEKSQIMHSWLPPFAQKGSPYHRLSVFVLQQPSMEPIDLNVAKSKATTRDRFSLRALTTRLQLKPVGVNLFRSQWDEGTAGVMQRAGVEGADIEFKRERIEPLPYKRKDGSRFR